MKQINIKCNQCKKVFHFTITEEQYKQYISGEGLIQNIFPEIQPEYRELFISQICPDCWNKIFSYADEQE